MAYNPMTVVYGEHFSRVFTSDEDIRTSHSRHRSSFLNREKSLAQENVLALEVSAMMPPIPPLKHSLKVTCRCR